VGGGRSDRPGSDEPAGERLALLPDLLPTILTGFTNDADLIEAINLQRIHRYIPKPWNPDELRHTIENALEKHRLVLENRRLASELADANERLRAENTYLKAADAPRIVLGDTPAIRRLLDQISRLAPKNVTALITGETGTAKELVARSLHAASQRRDALFVAVNCAELSEDAAESRLFGHRKGSFTGAVNDHKGFFEVADGGTLFPDEVGELPLPIQGKLLRVLQEGEITRFGDAKSRPVDVRVIAATNRTLEQEVAVGRFRQDLLFRLNVVPLVVPPLRERSADIPLLAQHFLTLHARKMGMPPTPLAPEARDALCAYDFPGNVRDLENMMVRALVMVEPGEPITLAELPGVDPGVVPAGVSDAPALSDASAVAAADGLFAAVARFERACIERALETTGGNRTQAARALRISKRWLLKKLERYGTPEG
jgi:DNA-binding NtrC family response regulator